MIAEGASMLLDPDHPELWFATEDEAEACRGRLSGPTAGQRAGMGMYPDKSPRN